MCFVKTPSNNEMEKVDYIYHIGHLDCDFVDTKEYKKSYAKFNHFVTRKNGMLIIDYKKYGKYLFENFYRFNEEQKVAVFELCFYLSLIQDDIVYFIAREIGLPEELASPEAIRLLEKARIGYLDDNYQPTKSKTFSALLANEIAGRLGITNKWKVFEKFWNRKDMYQDYHEAVNQKQSPENMRTVYKLFN